MVSITALKMTIYIVNIALTILGGLLCIGGIIVAVSGNSSMVTAVGIVAIVIGVILLVAVFLGCRGAKKESLVMLFFFVGCLSIMVVIYLIQLLLFGFALGTDKNAQMKQMLDDYNTDSNTKKTWDNLQEENECCGIKGASDWTEKEMTVPNSCCNKDAGEKGRLEDPLCKDDKKKYLHNKGCKDQLLSLLNRMTYLALGISIFSIIIMAIQITVSVLLILEIKKQE